MAGIKADHAERLEFYDKLSRQRPLEEHELDRVAWLADREKSLERERAYRERNKEGIKEKQRDYLKTPKGKAKSARNFKAAYARNPAKYKRWSKEWRENNPEKYKAQQEKKNEKRRINRKVEKMSNIIEQIMEAEQEMFREHTGLTDWFYKDLPKIEEKLFNKLIETIGEENIHWITQAEYTHVGKVYKRGQIMISPTGIESLKAGREALISELPK